MKAQLPKLPDCRWIAIFKNDFNSIAFNHYVYSKEIIYWIKRTPNKNVHIAKSTGNAYIMRDFMFFDKDLNETPIAYQTNRWRCIAVTEISLDFFGSQCKIIIQDPHMKPMEFYLNGSRGALNNLNDNLYFSCILLFLKSLNPYESWKDISINNKVIYNSYLLKQEIPHKIKEAVYTNLQVNSVWYKGSNWWDDLDL